MVWPGSILAPFAVFSQEKEHAESAGRIVFASDIEGLGEDMEICIINADGSGFKRLTWTDDYAGYPAWSPDGKRIAFVIGTGRFRSDVCVMDADGSNQLKITASESLVSSPSWSPDGNWIAFDMGMAGNCDVCVVSLSGGEVRNLTEFPYTPDIDIGEYISGYFDGSPAWSPDGKKIAYVASRDGNEDIYVMKADGTGKTRLTSNEHSDQSPSWSPDGEFITFVSNRDSARYFNIYIMRSDGSDTKQLTSFKANAGSPVWSPDGRYIAFHADIDGNYELYIIDADGKKVRRLTDRPWRTEDFPRCAADMDDGTYRSITPMVGYDGDPDWGPDAIK